MTRFPHLHHLLVGDDEIKRLQQERVSLLTRQIGRPSNRKAMRDATHAQLRALTVKPKGGEQ